LPLRRPTIDRLWDDRSHNVFAEYRVKTAGVEKVKRAIQEFVPYLQEKEAGTRMYGAWQRKDDPTRFVHFSIFEDEAAHTVHANSAAQGISRFTTCVLQSGVEMPYRAIKTNIADSLNIIIHIQRRPGRRFVSEVLEILGYNAETDGYDLRTVSLLPRVCPQPRLMGE